MLFGVEGLQVIDAQAGPDGTVTVWVVTDHPGAAACPDCGTVSARPHDRVVTRPRDVRRGLDHMEVCWLKWRWKCGRSDAGVRRSPSRWRRSGRGTG